MQLSTFGESKTEDNTPSLANSSQSSSLDPKDTTSSIGENSADHSEASTINPVSETVNSIGGNSTTPSISENNLGDKDSKPADNVEVQTGVMPDSSFAQAESIKPKSKGKRLVSIFFLLLILALAGAATYYFFVVKKNMDDSGSNADEQQTAVEEPVATPEVVESVANDISDIVASDTPEGLTISQMQTLVAGIEKTREVSGAYPWDKLGNKPIPVMTGLFNPADEPAVAWLKTENAEQNPLTENMDVVAFNQDPNSIPIKIVGFNTWYAVCFEPESSEYKVKATFDKMAMDAGDEGTFICIKKDLQATSSEPAPLEGF